MIKIYTDGACTCNPGRGGFATYVVYEDGTTKSTARGIAHTTNNRAELLAIMLALLTAQSNPQMKCVIYSDSQYAVNSINEWMAKWATSGWNKKNADMFKVIYDSYDPKIDTNIKLEWLKGAHKLTDIGATKGNVIADGLATGIIAKCTMAQFRADIEWLEIMKTRLKKREQPELFR